MVQAEWMLVNSMTSGRFSIAALFFIFSSFAFADSSAQGYEQCRVISQNGTLDVSACRNSKVGEIRCYADIQLESGAKTRIWGGCVADYFECWSQGSSRVDACN